MSEKNKKEDKREKVGFTDIANRASLAYGALKGGETATNLNRLLQSRSGYSSKIGALAGAKAAAKLKGASLLIPDNEDTSKQSSLKGAIGGTMIGLANSLSEYGGGKVTHKEFDSKKKATTGKDIVVQEKWDNTKVNPKTLLELGRENKKFLSLDVGGKTLARAIKAGGIGAAVGYGAHYLNDKIRSKSKELHKQSGVFEVMEKERKKKQIEALEKDLKRKPESFDRENTAVSAIAGAGIGIATGQANHSVMPKKNRAIAIGGLKGGVLAAKLKGISELIPNKDRSDKENAIKGGIGGGTIALAHFADKYGLGVVIRNDEKTGRVDPDFLKKQKTSKLFTHGYHGGKLTDLSALKRGGGALAASIAAGSLAGYYGRPVAEKIHDLKRKQIQKLKKELNSHE